MAAKKLPEPLDLMVEQETAIDVLFGEIADTLVASLSLQGGTIDVAKTTRVLDTVLVEMFGTGPQDALDSRIGRTITAYADAGRMQVIRKNLATYRS